MADNVGKKFEVKFKEDFLKLPNASLDRLYDPMGGYGGIRNICDYIGYIYPNIFYLEIKTHKGNTFPLTNLSQYDKLISKVGIKGVRSGVVLWLYDHDTIMYVPISSIKKMKEDGKKSINIKMVDEGNYKIYVIPSVKKKVYLDSDYTILTNLLEGE